MRLPKIIPYVIGVCTDTPGSFEYFKYDPNDPEKGDPIEQLMEYLLKKFETETVEVVTDWGEIKRLPITKINLCAFNIDYDFKVIRPKLCEMKKDEFDIYYEMTEKKKFMRGGIISKKHGTKCVIHFTDLGR